MKFHELVLTKKLSRKRVGRGISAGGGKTAGRGTKGQKARTGKKLKPGFEGGQTKLSMRLPKARGFKHAPAVSYQIINLADLKIVKGTRVDAASLAKAGLIKHANRPVKLLGHGQADQAYKISVQAATKAAIAAIEKAQGSVTIVELKSDSKKPAQSATNAA